MYQFNRKLRHPKIMIGRIARSVFFGGIYVIWGVEKFPLKKMVHLEEPLSRSIFVLRPFQKKNPREKTKISPRCARRQGKRRRKNKRKSFLIFVSSDQKPQKGVFSLNLAANQGARSARKLFRVFSASEASMLKKSTRNFPT